MPKASKHLIYLGCMFLALFLGISIFTFYKSNELINKGYLASEGQAAENFAVLTAANIHLSDAQVKKLKGYTYHELQNSKENKQLEQMMSNENFVSKVDYAYLMVHLNKNEIKYKVTKENKKLFDAPIGTNLDILWLLDVTVDRNIPGNTGTTNTSDDVDRYSYYQKKDSNIFHRSPTYVYNSSEWGEHICGYSPIYSTEGTYIGVIGVELKTHSYAIYRDKSLQSMAILFIVTSVTLILFFMILYSKYRKLQFERVYTDSLTKIYNRSYYNDQFIKKMNGMRQKHNTFALMIMDIDFFKKVNDTFGHEIGDQVLVESAQILSHTFGKGHVVRFGGEEFVIGLWIDDEADLKIMLDQLYEDIQKTRFSSQEINLTISLGCTLSENEDISGWLLSDMLKQADHNLYHSKEHGRAQYKITKKEQ